MLNPARTALITGATGFVAQALTRKLVAAGWQVRGTIREANRRPRSENIELVCTGSLGSETNWSSIVRNIGVVFHLASRVHRTNEVGPSAEVAYRAENTIATLTLAKAAAQAGVAKFVFCSTVKVNGGERARPYTESDDPAPVDAYAASKWEAELGLRSVEVETGMPAFVLRPPLVYGPQVKANFLALVRLVDRGWPLPFAGVRNSRSLIGVENLADALIACAEAPGPGRTYLVSDCDDVSTPELLMRLGTALGRPVRLFHLPATLLDAGLRAGGMGAVAARLLGSLRVDSAQARRNLGWVPRVSMGEQLDLLAGWYRARAGEEKI